uniref:Putative secreted protein n=1 Tax=Ixodes ricinus TaxID=34613 RepID=A0A6B0U4D6_IXORI
MNDAAFVVLGRIFVRQVVGLLLIAVETNALHQRAWATAHSRHEPGEDFGCLVSTIKRRIPVPSGPRRTQIPPAVATEPT